MGEGWSGLPKRSLERQCCAGAYYRGWVAAVLEEGGGSRFVSAGSISCVIECVMGICLHLLCRREAQNARASEAE